MSNREKLLMILKNINTDINYEDATNLVDDGKFDSLEVMCIVNGIEECFQIEIDPDDVIAENFNCLDNLIILVQKYIQEK